MIYVSHVDREDGDSLRLFCSSHLEQPAIWDGWIWHKSRPFNWMINDWVLRSAYFQSDVMSSGSRYMQTKKQYIIINTSDSCLKDGFTSALRNQLWNSDKIKAFFQWQEYSGIIPVECGKCPSPSISEVKFSLFYFTLLTYQSNF